MLLILAPVVLRLLFNGVGFGSWFYRFLGLLRFGGLVLWC